MISHRNAKFEILVENRTLKSAFAHWLRQTDYVSVVNLSILSSTFFTLKSNTSFKVKSRILNQRAIKFCVFNCYSKGWYGLRMEWLKGRDRRLEDMKEGEDVISDDENDTIAAAPPTTETTTSKKGLLL